MARLSFAQLDARRPRLRHVHLGLDRPALAAWLIRSHGTTGAVVANAAGQLIATTWVFVAMTRRHGCRFPAGDVVKIAAAAGLAFLVTSVTGPGPDQVDAGRLALGAAAGTLTFVVLCGLARVIGRREWDALLARGRWGAPRPAQH